MPKVALADTLQDWQTLITAAREHAGRHPELKTLLDALQERLDRAKALEAERASLRARRQRATQELQEAREEGKELAARARAVLKAKLGTSHAGLTQFNIRPRRPYGRRQPKPETGQPSARKSASPRKTRRSE